MMISQYIYIYICHSCLHNFISVLESGKYGELCPWYDLGKDDLFVLTWTRV